MKNFKHIALAAAVAATTATSVAQTLEQEVVIDREIVPVERAVNRPTWVTPAFLAPTVNHSPLSLNEYTSAAQLTRAMKPLPAAQWADSVMRTPYNGYAAIGYFPVYNLGATAGYRFVNNDRYTAGAQLSYQGSSWNGFEDATGHYNQHKLNIGADAALRTAPGTLTAHAHYTWWSTGTADYVNSYNRGTQGLNMAGVGLSWKPSSYGTDSRFQWTAGASVDYAGFIHNMDLAMPHILVGTDYHFDPVKDLNVDLSADMALRVGTHRYIKLGVKGQLQHTNCWSSLYPYAYESITTGKTEAGIAPYQSGGENLGIISVTPAYSVRKGRFALDLGLRLDFNTGGFNTDVHAAPAIDMQWAPSSLFKLHIAATGGEVMNNSSRLWQRNQWTTGAFTWERSHINADMRADITVGSYRGFWATVHGGWASTSDWLCPVTLHGVNTWAVTNEMNAFYYGLELGYAWTDKVIVKGHANSATHCKYYRWDDNAKWEFNIAARVKATSQLSVEAGYEVRTDRRGYILTPVVLETPWEPIADIQHSTCSLGNTSNLFLSAQYDFTPAFTAFLKTSNLLNHDWFIVQGIRSRGINGLLGVQYKF